jgi:hypothetical protein
MADYEDNDNEEGKGDAEPNQNLFQRHDIFLGLVLASAVRLIISSSRFAVLAVLDEVVDHVRVGKGRGVPEI